MDCAKCGREDHIMYAVVVNGDEVEYRCAPCASFCVVVQAFGRGYDGERRALVD